MANFLTNAKQYGQQTSVGVFTLQANEPLAGTFKEAATEQQGGDPEGVSYPIKVMPSDSLLSSDWIIINASYSETGSVVTLTQQGPPIASSNGYTGPVDFSGYGPEGLAIMGVFSHQQLPELVSSEIFDVTIFTTQVAGNDAALSSSFSVTPSKGNTRLRVTYRSNALLQNLTGQAQSNMRFTSRLQWFDGSLWNNTGFLTTAGILGNTAVTVSGYQHRDIIHHKIALTSSQVNQVTGDWEFRLTGGVTVNDLKLTVAAAVVFLDEKE